ncbi:MAG: D-alanine--D-alanine ligase [Clostridia bacterium]|nr:D-alanine--D-alanine ligase [Clostridia bacterium]
MKIAVLAGGLSPEREVSLSSGSLIANALCGLGHEVALADVYLGTCGKTPDELFNKNGNYPHKIPENPPDLEALKKEAGIGERLIGHGIAALVHAADVVFLALHGGMGENGQLQAYLDCLGIKYTGSGFASCLAAMDKNLSKTIFRAAGVPTADWVYCTADEAAEKEIAFPCVIKPCSCGSSVGVTMVDTKEEFSAALEAAKKYEDNIIIEEKLFGREFSIGVLAGKALPPIEIRPKGEGFYDFAKKYQQGLTEEICPAPLTQAQAERLSELALRAHKALGLGDYSRIDFILDEEKGDFYCLEANTLPGMTPTSLLPQEAAAAGIPYGELCEMIAKTAYDK